MSASWEVFFAGLGAIVAFAGMGLALYKMIARHIDNRFDDSERNRAAGADLYEERLKVRDQQIADVMRRIETAHAEHADMREHLQAIDRRFEETRRQAEMQFVSRELYLEAVSGIKIKLEKLAERLFAEGRFASRSDQ